MSKNYCYVIGLVRAKGEEIKTLKLNTKFFNKKNCFKNNHNDGKNGFDLKLF